MEDVEEALQAQLNHEWRQFRLADEWVPALIDLGGYKALDVERLEDDMDHRAWGYYRAGQIEAYGKALRELEKRGDG